MATFYSTRTSNTTNSVLNAENTSKLAGKVAGAKAAAPTNNNSKRAALGDVTNGAKNKLGGAVQPTRAAAAAGGARAVRAALPMAVNSIPQPGGAALKMTKQQLSVQELHDDAMALDQHSVPVSATSMTTSTTVLPAATTTATAAATATATAMANNKLAQLNARVVAAAAAPNRFAAHDDDGEFGDAAAHYTEQLDEGSDDHQQMTTLISDNVGQAVVADTLAAAAPAPTVAVTDYEDIDNYDGDDPQSVVEYIDDIFRYLRFKERDPNDVPDANYMQRQRDLTPKMRAILVDWMVDVQIKFKLLSETMFLTVNIIDRFLSRVEVKRDKLQLVGVTAMLLASKYEEIYSPEVRDFVYISDKAFTSDELLALEIKILNELRFSLTPATPLHFLRRFSKAARSDATTHTLSKYLIELALPEYNMLQFSASMIAASAVYIARAMHQITPLWNSTLLHYTQYSAHDLRECVMQLNKALLTCWDAGAPFKATKRKFSSAKFLEVGKIQPLEHIPF